MHHLWIVKIDGKIEAYVALNPVKFTYGFSPIIFIDNV
jgi:hypothetical protein